MAKRSEVWIHFVKEGEEAKCRICQKSLSCRGGSTTGLRNHLMIHNIQLNTSHELPPPMKKLHTQTSITEFSKRESLDEVIARLAAEDGISYLKISQSKFIHSALCARGFIPVKSHCTISRMVIRYAKHIKELITSELQVLLANGIRFSVSLDEYTSIQNIRYMNVNVHSRNNFWNLGMKKINGKMPAEKVLDLLIEKLHEYKIDLNQHIVSIVCDGAPVMVKMGRLSKIHQQICLVHGVHLAVVDVLYSKDSTSIDLQETVYDIHSGYNNMDSTPLIDDIISENSDVEECSEDDGDEVYDDVTIPPYALNINATITKVRNIVRMFRKSPLKSETLKKYINEHLGINLNLILDCKTRWNSLISMIDRFLTVRKPLCKAMIDINTSTEICERDWQVLENVLSILKPIEMGILALCKRESTLLSAEGIFEFMFEQLRTCILGYWVIHNKTTLKVE